MQYEHQFIKIVDKKLADILCLSGFSYITEKYNKQTIYVFPFDSKLCELIDGTLNASYEFSGQVICESKLRF